MTIIVKCPYCGVKNKTKIELDGLFEKKIITCDLDDGGCDKDFVVKTKISINAECKKIEGE